MPVGTQDQARVSLLLDENLSPRLIQRLPSLFPRLTHLRDVNDRMVKSY